MKKMNLPTLEPLAVRPNENLSPEEKEQWRPTWNCFCCQDTGRIQPNLVRLVMPNYDDKRDRFPICQNCSLGHNWLHLEGNYDSRLTPDICSKLDRISRQDWEQIRRSNHENHKSKIQFEQELQKLTQAKNLRKRDRSSEEEMFVTQYSRNIRENLELEPEPEQSSEEKHEEVEV